MDKMLSPMNRVDKVLFSPSADDEYLPSGYLTIPETGPLTPQHISDFDHQRKLQREQISIYTQPIRTLYLLIEGGIVLLKYSIYYSFTHPFMIYLIIPLLGIWLLLDYVGPQDKMNPYRIAIDQIEFYAQFCTWWIGLGIFSSIGLGSGLQSGVLFMFPHIFRTCLAAQSCKTMDFDSYSNMWFREPSNLFKCPSEHHDVNAYNNVTFFNMWRKVVLVCFLQATGTAIGEIPPYWMTRAARLAALESGCNTEDADEIPEELETNSQYSYINRLKEWMVSFLQAHGFYGVLCMASFPNLAFDLCGICCGHYLMPFWTFFWATFLGKALIRNSYQSVIYVALCSEHYLEWLIKALQYLAPDSLHIDQTIRKLLEEGRGSFQRLSNGDLATDTTTPSISYSNSPTSLSMFIPNLHFSSVSEAFNFYWQVVFMRSILLLFILSCITQFAQYYQLIIDRQDSQVLRHRLPRQVLDIIESPVSGRLHLPLPSTKKKRRSNKKSNTSSVVSSSIDPTQQHHLMLSSNYDQKTIDSPMLTRGSRSPIRKQSQSIELQVPPPPSNSPKPATSSNISPMRKSTRTTSERGT